MSDQIGAPEYISVSDRRWAVADVVEYGRGQLAALSYALSDQARDVHILRLRNAFDRAGVGLRLKFVLRVLNLMREVQELKGGYWVPTPLRLVTLNKDAILLAPIPTEELKRHFGDVERAGYARVLPDSCGIDLPRQALEDWAGFDSMNARIWAELAIERAWKEISPTVEPKSIEYFCLKRISTAMGDRTSPHWTTDPRRAVAAKNRILFCRSRQTESYYRYFLGTVEKGRLATESSPPKEVDRLHYGFAAVVGQPITVFLDKRQDGYLLRIFAPLPRPERRLLLALAVRRNSESGKVYELRTEAHSHLLSSKLQRLGCEIQETHVR